MDTTKSLAKLKKLWYQKLRESGFKDIERKDGTVGRGAPRVDNLNDVQKQAIQDYYSMCRNFLEEHTFDNEVERFIWSLHSEGTSVRDISNQLQKINITKKKDATWYVVKRLVALMKTRYGVSK